MKLIFFSFLCFLNSEVLGGAQDPQVFVEAIKNVLN